MSGERARAKDRPPAQINDTLSGIPARVDELAVVAVVAEQQRAQMRPRSFRVSQANDDELLAIEAFGFRQSPRFPGA